MDGDDGKIVELKRGGIPPQQRTEVETGQDLMSALRDTIDAFSGRVSNATVIGCLHALSVEVTLQSFMVVEE